MSRPEKPDTRDAQMADFDRRLRALEVGGRAEHTTMQGGLFRIRDVQGDLRAALGDLDDDGTTWGFEVTRGGVFRVRDAAGELRGALGDIDDDDNFYALVLFQGGVVQVRDEDGTPKATLGDLGPDPDSLLPLHGLDVFNGGVVRVFTGGAMQVFDGGVIQVIADGLLQVINGAAFSAGPNGSGPFPVWAGDLELRLGPDYAGKYGLVVGPNSADVHMWADEDGLHDPFIPVPVVDFNAQKATTNTSFESLWAARPHRIGHAGLVSSITYAADPGTTGEVRISHSGGSTDSVTIADGANDTAQFAWLHGIDVPAGPVVFDIEARVTSGAGSIYLFVPDLAMCDPTVCTATGLP